LIFLCVFFYSLGSFFWGYLLTQIPGGWASHRYGGKWLFGLGLLVTGLFALVTPFAARLGKETLVLVRIIQGFAGVRRDFWHLKDIVVSFHNSTWNSIWNFVWRNVIDME